MNSENNHTAGIKEKVNRFVDSQADNLLEVSHEIHANPELAFKEFKAAETLTNAISKNGLPVTKQA